MDTGKFVGLLVAFLVGALVLTAFVPIIDSTQHTIEKTINQNEGYNHTMDLISDDVTIEINYSNGASTIDVTVGTTTKEVDVSTTATPRTLLFYSDICMLFVDRIANENAPVYAVKSTGYTGNLSNATSVFTYNNTTKAVTLVVGDVETYTDTVEKFAYVYDGNAGKYGFFDTNANPTVNKDATIEVMSLGGWWANSIVTYTATGQAWYNSTTTPIQGMVITAPATPEEYSATITGTWTDNGNKTYTRSSNLLNASYNDGETDKTLSQTSVTIAPIEYVSYEENATSDIVGLLPLVAGVGMLIWAVAYFLRRY